MATLDPKEDNNEKPANFDAEYQECLDNLPLEKKLTIQ